MRRAPIRLALAAALAAPASAQAGAWDMAHVAGAIGPVPASMFADPRARVDPDGAATGEAPDGGAAARLIADAEESIKAAEQAAAAEKARTEAELAERLVAGQVQLEAGDAEGAAVVFLDLLENAPETPAGAQARFYLGEALLQLGMRRWAVECFSRTLADGGLEARRLHQRSVARLLGLAAPARERGLARKPGLSVMPELRARLQGAGLGDERGRPGGELSAADIGRLRGWVAAVAPDQRVADLRYAWGRFLFLTGEHREAQAELDALAPLDVPLTTRDRAGRFRVRATYIAGAAAAALGQLDDALVRFDRIVNTRSLSRREDGEVRDLAWMARGRILHDRGDYDGALLGYRQIGRASPLYPAALYEIAWTLLRADRHEAALAALEQLLRDTPSSPAAPEAKALRGKLQIRRRHWKAAESEFSALRREFDAQEKALAPALAVEADALGYAAALIRSDPRHFALDAVVPRGALTIARGLPRAVQAERLARETGEVEAMLRDTFSLLERMETAAASPERALLFTDLGAHWTALDRAAAALGEAGDALLARTGRAGSGELERQRGALRRALDVLATGRSKHVRRVADLGDAVRAAEQEAEAIRARLQGLEYTHREMAKRRTPDPFFKEAAELRDELAALEASLADQRGRLDHARATLRFVDPLPGTRRDALAEQRRVLAQLWQATSAAADAETKQLWSRRERLLQRIDAARRRVDAAASARLRRAVTVLKEERDNLTRYRAELDALRPRAEASAAEAVHAAVRDVAAELRYWKIRAEVGLLDVAWATKEAELEQTRDLERARERGTKLLDRSIDQALEDSE